MDPSLIDAARKMALTPDGRFLFVGGNVLTTYAVDATSGALTRIN